MYKDSAFTVKMSKDPAPFLHIYADAVAAAAALIDVGIESIIPFASCISVAAGEAPGGEGDRGKLVPAALEGSM